MERNRIRRQTRESGELTGIENLNLLLAPQSLQEAGRGKKRYEKKRRQILGQEIQSLSEGCLAFVTILGLKVPSLTPGPASFSSVSICPGPRSGSAPSAPQPPLDWKEIFHRAREALASQAGCWTEKGVVGCCCRGCRCHCCPTISPSSISSGARSEHRAWEEGSGVHSNIPRRTPAVGVFGLSLKMSSNCLSPTQLSPVPLSWHPQGCRHHGVS